MKPDPEEVVQSALKGIQTVIENLTLRLTSIFKQFKVMLMLFPAPLITLTKQFKMLQMKWQSI